MSLQSSIAGSTTLPALLLQQSSNPLGSWSGTIMMLLVMGIFYVVLILPMARQRKNLQKMVEALKKGDKVITTGGLFGEVSGVEGDKVLLRIADNVRVRVAKSAIAGMEAEGDKSDKSDKGSAS
jgi:preprotein translocase subunit YajC